MSHTTLVSLLDSLMKSWSEHRAKKREANKAAAAARMAKRVAKRIEENEREYGWIDKSIAEQKAKERALKRTKLIEVMSCTLAAQARSGALGRLQQRDIDACVDEATDYVDKLMSKCDPVPADNS